MYLSLDPSLPHNLGVALLEVLAGGKVRHLPLCRGKAPDPFRSTCRAVSKSEESCPSVTPASGFPPSPRDLT